MSMKQRNRSPTTKAAVQRFAVIALRFIAVYIVLFSIAQYVSFLITGSEQTQLIESTYTVIGLECGGLLLKRIVEKAFGRRNTEED